jgi:hypothetical protein
MKRFTSLLAFSIICFAASAQQKKLFAEAAIRLSGDAELAFVGPAFSAGGGVNLGKRFSFAASYTFFAARFRDDAGRQTFKTNTLDLVGLYHFQNVFNPAKGFYAGGGAGIQSRKTSETFVIQQNSYTVAVFNIGYRFPVLVHGKKRSLSIDAKAMGPYIEHLADGDYVEVLTQLMIGVRFRY